MSEKRRKVIEHLDLAVKAAEREQMSTSELIGLLFYYAHNLAQRARETALEAETDGGEAG